MSEYISPLGMGWVRDYPDIRDYTVESSQVSPSKAKLGETVSIKDMLKQLNIAGANKARIQEPVDLRPLCPPIENQGALGSCTAHAGVGMVEYFEKNAFGSYTDASRLFLYKTTRNLLQWTGDTGAFLRSTMGAMVLFGVPPEKYWQYDTAKFDIEPSPFLYAYAQNFQALSYYRLDPPGMPPKELLEQIKKHLAAKLPLMFGFTVYNSYKQHPSTGEIPFPCPGERTVGGHAVMAVGYNDKKAVTNTNCGKTTNGALLIRNSWGTGWGEAGYGWLPYEYVVKGLAVDWWALIKNEWVNTGAFGL